MAASADRTIELGLKLDGSSIQQDMSAIKSKMESEFSKIKPAIDTSKMVPKNISDQIKQTIKPVKQTITPDINRQQFENNFKQSFSNISKAFGQMLQGDVRGVLGTIASSGILSELFKGLPGMARSSVGSALGVGSIAAATAIGRSASVLPERLIKGAGKVWASGLGEWISPNEKAGGVAENMLRENAKARALAEGLASKVKALFASITANILKIGAVVGSFAAVALVVFAGAKATMNHLDTQVKEARSLGTTYGLYQSFNQASMLSGLTPEMTHSALGRLQYGLGTESEKSMASLKKLGISKSDVMGEGDPVAILVKLAKALNQVQNPTEKATIAMDLFGRGAYKQMLLLAAGAKGMEAEMSKHFDTNMKLGEMTGTSEAFNDMLERLGTSVKLVALQIGSSLIPILDNLGGGLRMLGMGESKGGYTIEEMERKSKAQEMVQNAGIINEGPPWKKYASYLRPGGTIGLGWNNLKETAGYYNPLPYIGDRINMVKDTVSPAYEKVNKLEKNLFGVDHQDIINKVSDFFKKKSNFQLQKEFVEQGLTSRNSITSKSGEFDAIKESLFSNGKSAEDLFNHMSEKIAGLDPEGMMTAAKEYRKKILSMAMQGMDPKLVAEFEEAEKELRQKAEEAAKIKSAFNSSSDHLVQVLKFMQAAGESTEEIQKLLSGSAAMKASDKALTPREQYLQNQNQLGSLAGAGLISGDDYQKRKADLAENTYGSQFGQIIEGQKTEMEKWIDFKKSVEEMANELGKDSSEVLAKAFDNTFGDLIAFSHEANDPSALDDFNDWLKGIYAKSMELNTLIANSPDKAGQFGSPDLNKRINSELQNRFSFLRPDNKELISDFNSLEGVKGYLSPNQYQSGRQKLLQEAGVIPGPTQEQLQLQKLADLQGAGAISGQERDMSLKNLYFGEDYQKQSSDIMQQLNTLGQPVAEAYGGGGSGTLGEMAQSQNRYGDKKQIEQINLQKEANTLLERLVQLQAASLQRYNYGANMQAQLT